MKNNRHSGFESRVEEESRSTLDEILREGARRMLQLAIEAEVSDYIENHKEVLDESGHRLVVRNGHLPSRVLQSGAGPIPVRQPRINDRREDHKFSSSILPAYMRRSPGIKDLIPLLYLKGVSTNAFGETLVSILGPQARGLSPSTISRLKQVWQEEYLEWKDRDLSGKRYVYIWADGVYFNVRLSTDRPCLLVNPQWFSKACLSSLLARLSPEFTRYLVSLRKPSSSWS